MKEAPKKDGNHATYCRARMWRWEHPVGIEFGRRHMDHCWSGHESSQLVVLKIAQPILAEVVAVCMSGEKNLCERYDPLDHMLLVYHCLCRPESGFD